jgi:hypothetical protein
VFGATLPEGACAPGNEDAEPLGAAGRLGAIVFPFGAGAIVSAGGVASAICSVIAGLGETDGCVFAVLGAGFDAHAGRSPTIRTNANVTRLFIVCSSSFSFLPGQT